VPSTETGRSDESLHRAPSASFRCRHRIRCKSLPGRTVISGLQTPGLEDSLQPVPTRSLQCRHQQSALCITAGPNGTIWFTEYGPNGNNIGRITLSGTVTEFSIPTKNSQPSAIAAAPDGNLWFTEENPNANKIGRITPSGIITEFPIPTANSQPAGIVAALTETSGSPRSGPIRSPRLPPEARSRSFRCHSSIPASRITFARRESLVHWLDWQHSARHVAITKCT